MLLELFMSFLKFVGLISVFITVVSIAFGSLAGVMMVWDWIFNFSDNIPYEKYTAAFSLTAIICTAIAFFINELIKKYENNEY